MTAILKSRLPEIATSLPIRVGPALALGAEGVAAEAKARVPVQSGALRDAIHVEKDEQGFSVVAGDTRAFYGHITEHGSVHSAPHPFLVPALESQKEAILAQVTAVLKTL